MTEPTVVPEPDADLHKIMEDDTHKDDSQKLVLNAEEPKPTLTQGSTFPNPEPTTVNETAPVVTELRGDIRFIATESNVNALLSSERPETREITADFEERNPQEILD
jgi:hypothetical protein